MFGFCAVAFLLCTLSDAFDDNHIGHADELHDNEVNELINNQPIDNNKDYNNDRVKEYIKELEKMKDNIGIEMAEEENDGMAIENYEVQERDNVQNPIANISNEVEIIHPATEKTFLEMQNVDDSDDYSIEETVSWDRFISTLVKFTKERFMEIRTNIKRNYKLMFYETELIEDAFNNEIEYDYIIKKQNKFVKESQSINVTEETMLNFMDMSNFIVGKVIEMKLKSVKGNLDLPLKWHNQTMRDKIIRQETKATTAAVENHICSTLYICKENFFYSDYIKEWLRILLNTSKLHLTAFFRLIPDVLEKHKHFIKSNLKLRETIKNIIQTDSVQKDIIDFLDEIITNGENIVFIAPPGLKKSASLLKELLFIIDSVYNVNTANRDKLETMIDVLQAWIDNKEKLSLFFEYLIENLKVNMPIWSLKVQSNINNLWSELIVL